MLVCTSQTYMRYDTTNMLTLYGFVLIGILSERLALLLPPGRTRRVLAAVIIVVHAWVLGFLLFNQASVYIGAIGIVSLFRIFNMIRLAKQRMHEVYLQKVLRRTLWWLAGMQVLIVVSSQSGLRIQIDTLLLFSTLAACILLTSTILRIWRSRAKTHSDFLADKELPTLSILIPARNETEDLASCIRSILANDYPKLEVIVLDDCSSDTTAEIIKDFAQDGVRFISNTEVSETWLQKNLVYQTLLDAASGRYVVFCGVDVRFAPDALRKLIEQLAAEKLEMLSVLPRRYSIDPRNIISQTFRYFWELSLPRFTKKRPPVLSTLWVAERKRVIKAGGFAAAKRMIVPEAYFARYFAARRTYKFVLANDRLRIETVKIAHEQYATALRTRYPQLHRRPELVCLLTAAEATLLIFPFVYVAFQLIATAAILPQAILACILLLIVNLLIVLVSNPANAIFALVSFPLAAISDVCVLFVSMWRYEVGEIVWKERNVCIPTMHVIPSLPPLPDKK